VGRRPAVACDIDWRKRLSCTAAPSPPASALQDSATLFSICTFLKQVTGIMDNTMVISLLQPSPEVMQLFDDVILMAQG
jgi:hypothetical protein